MYIVIDAVTVLCDAILFFYFIGGRGLHPLILSVNFKFLEQRFFFFVIRLKIL